MASSRWIVTLDVLKYYEWDMSVKSYARLNSNIRCIEMGSRKINVLVACGWIVTLDVLKCIFNNCLVN